MLNESISRFHGTLIQPRALKNSSRIETYFDDEASIAFFSTSGEGRIASTLSPMLVVNFISTFDQDLDQFQGQARGFLQTTLDGEIAVLQHEYLDFQLSLNKKIRKHQNGNDGNADEVAFDLYFRVKEAFLDIIDDLFYENGKEVDREENEISFLSGEQKIKTNQLSAGEKQLLIILMTVLVQDNKPSILFLDEPEISLHIDWQKKLIGYIRELNPNCQVILATHSPAIIMEGWADCVFEVRDLITLDRNAVPQ
jgi:hypothetical protein